MDDAVNTAKKQRGTPFKKGKSGNPAGRPKGSRNAATLAAEALMDGEAEDLTRLLLDAAKGGDMTALRFCVDRILPTRRERILQFPLPPLNTAADGLAAIKHIAEGVADGELTDTQAAALLRLVDGYMRGLGQVDYEQRLADIERKMAEVEKSGES